MHAATKRAVAAVHLLQARLCQPVHSFLKNWMWASWNLYWQLLSHIETFNTIANHIYVKFIWRLLYVSGNAGTWDCPWKSCRHFELTPRSDHSWGSMKFLLKYCIPSSQILLLFNIGRLSRKKAIMCTLINAYATHYQFSVSMQTWIKWIMSACQYANSNHERTVYCLWLGWFSISCLWHI